MNELVRLVSEKAGISEQNSRTAVDTVINYLKKKLPEPVASQLDSVTKGDGTSGGGGGGVMKGLGDLLGGKK